MESVCFKDKTIMTALSKFKLNYILSRDFCR